METSGDRQDFPAEKDLDRIISEGQRKTQRSKTAVDGLRQRGHMLSAPLSSLTS